MDTILNKDLAIKSIFVTTSKAYKIAKYLEQNNLKDIKLIGYDLLSENIHYLKNNYIDFLIHQNPKEQVYLGIKFLVEFFLFNKEIPEKNLLPIDIISKENYLSYMK